MHPSGQFTVPRPACAGHHTGSLRAGLFFTHSRIGAHPIYSQPDPAVTLQTHQSANCFALLPLAPFVANPLSGCTSIPRTTILIEQSSHRYSSVEKLLRHGPGVWAEQPRTFTTASGNPSYSSRAITCCHTTCFGPLVTLSV